MTKAITYAQWGCQEKNERSRNIRKSNDPEVPQINLRDQTTDPGRNRRSALGFFCFYEIVTPPGKWYSYLKVDWH